MKKIILISFFIYAVTCEFTLNILHLNDVHARFEETNIYSGRCGETDKKNNNCYGGFARIHSKVSELRNSLENTLFLSGGDYFQGTVWYSIHKWRAMAYFLNILDHDAMVLGNHEFDDGIEGIVPFIDNITFPVVTANIDAALEPTFQDKVPPSVVKTFGGTKVGIIGYITTETEFIGNPGKLKILNEADSVREEARRLKSEGVDIIIALGHAGFIKDKYIAENVAEVDVIVGGHTNTFLYDGDEPSTEESVGLYPTIVTQPSGRKVPVVQAYAFGKYLGHLKVTFNDDGEAVEWSGNPILLDNTVSQDETILKEMVPWKADMAEIITETVGRTFVFLDGNRLSCRMKECNLGNLVTDAIVHQNAKYPDDMEWAQTALAVVNGGSIRASIDERSSNGSISMEDILTLSPFQNSIDIVELKGKHLKEMFEFSVRNYDKAAIYPAGRFLQVSGFHVIYDLGNDVGSRLIKLEARCVACRIPVLEPVEDEKIYKIAMPTYLANGGDAYEVIRENKVKHHVTGLLDADIISQYVRLYTPIYQGLENRILFLKKNDPCHSTECYSTNNQTEDDCQQVEIVNLPKDDPSNSNTNKPSLAIAVGIAFIYVLSAIK